ncbi:hypothetical protein GGQ92_002883 [Gracilibacillus halotolerans]|uniref:Uncharacterized protein n=1 Tax=Gracilibacillus halotolerans TaxID=74386 RepID=A0A841RQD4_9BACI|nr:hypothetical protein [Gracilibacillus halotolerans]
MKDQEKDINELTVDEYLKIEKDILLKVEQ